MKTTDIIKTIKSTPSNAFTILLTSRELKLKGGGKAFKVSGFTIRNNASYANQKNVKEAVARGDRQEAQTPAWAESIKIDGVRVWIHRKTLQQYIPCVVSTILRGVYFNDQGAQVDPSTLPLYAKDKPREKVTNKDLAGKGQHLFVAPKVETVFSIKTIKIDALDKALESKQAHEFLTERALEGVEI